MDLEERVQRLERRFREMEDLIEDLQAAIRGPLPEKPPEVVAPPPPPPPPTPRPRALREPRPPEPAVSTAVINPARGGEVVSEEWIGRWGLLATGVVLVVLAAGYFVKLAIDRGWISPLMRCSAGAALGAALAYTGWRLHERGLRSYGAALIGCGAAVVYIAVWAAVRWYSLLPPTIGLGMVALLSVGVFAAARVIDIEALGAAAALGAFAAPAMLGSSGNPDLLLLYSVSLATGLGWVAERGWRLTTFLIGLSFFLIGRAAPAAPSSVLMYSVLGASAALYVGLREGWRELRALSFAGGWILLGIAAGRMALGPHPLVSAGAIVLAGPIWWRGFRHGPIWPQADPSAAESLYFYLTPWLLAWGLGQFAPLFFRAHGWVVWVVVAAPYLAAGYSRPRVPFAVAGAATLIVAMLRASSGPGAAWGLLALAVLWAGLDHVLARTDGRWYTLAAFAVALVHLLSWDAGQRGRGPAFADAWALAFWGATLVAAMLAAGLWRQVESVPQTPPRNPRPYLRQGKTLAELLPFARPAFWVLAGAMLFLGVTAELLRYFRLSALPLDAAQRAGGLLVSGWWVAFAVGLVLLALGGSLRPALVLSGAAVLAAAIVHLLAVDLPLRGPGLAFGDAWGLMFWLMTAGAAAFAAVLWRRLQGSPPWAGWEAIATANDLVMPLCAALWVIAGLMVFLGVSGELIRAFDQAGLSQSTASLAAGLSVSAWWAFFAAGLVALGFWRGLKQARVAGLLVSGLAVLKVVFFDLSQLSAMYRVASVLTLGLVSLAVAYLYHRYTAGQSRKAQKAA